MALRVTVEDNFDQIENVPGQIEQALANGWKIFTILPNGELVNADTHMKASLGPIVGEVTNEIANIVIEVRYKGEGKLKHSVGN